MNNKFIDPIKSKKMTSNSKRRKKQRTAKIFSNRTVRKCKHTQTGIEQTNYHTWIIPKIQFRSSFNSMIESNRLLKGIKYDQVIIQCSNPMRYYYIVHDSVMIISICISIISTDVDNSNFSVTVSMRKILTHFSLSSHGDSDPYLRNLRWS